MMSYDGEDLFALIAAIVFGLVICTAISVAIINSKWDRECMDHGYRDAKIVWFLTPYCVQRVDQTDIVISLKKVREGKDE